MTENRTGNDLPECRRKVVRLTRESTLFTEHDLGPGLTLRHLQTNKIKTNQLNLFWVGELGDQVASRALLGEVLSRGTRSHPNLKAMTRHLESLYGAQFSTDVFKAGLQHVIVFRFEFVADRFIPSGESLLARLFELVRELIFEPRLEQDHFLESVVEQEKRILIDQVDSLINSKAAYAQQRLVEAMCPEEEYRRYDLGTVEEIRKITPKSLTDYWRSLLSTSPVDVYFAGSVPADEVVRAFEEIAAPFGKRQVASPPHRVALPAAPAEPRLVTETLDVEQSQLLLGYRTQVTYADPASAALSLANGIFGQFPHSRLFRKVREEASLCYSIHSSLNRLYGMLTVQAGINAQQYEKARGLIQDQLARMQQGEINDGEFQATKLAFDNRLEMAEDSPGQLLGLDLSFRLAGATYDHNRYRRELAETGVDAVVEAAQRVELDTVYWLKPTETP